MRGKKNYSSKYQELTDSPEDYLGLHLKIEIKPFFLMPPKDIEEAWKREYFGNRLRMAAYKFVNINEDKLIDEILENYYDQNESVK